MRFRNALVNLALRKAFYIHFTIKLLTTPMSRNYFAQPIIVGNFDGRYAGFSIDCVHFVACIARCNVEPSTNLTSSVVFTHSFSNGNF